MKLINFKIWGGLLVFCLILSCTSNTKKIENVNQGKLTATMQLSEVQTKRIILDTNTAPKPQYIQIYKDINNLLNLTFLNTYNNSIYFYNYQTSAFLKKISYDKKGPDGIEMPLGYHIKNMDSIYVFNYINLELLIANDKSKVLGKIPLTENQDFKKSSSQSLYYSQFLPETSNPFLETSKELLLPAQYIRTIPDSLISKIKFLERVNLKTNELTLNDTYPASLYGKNYNWDDETFTEVFGELHPDGDKLIYSFPISHELYITKIGSEQYKTVYGGSNFAGTILSIDKKPNKTTRENLIQHIASQDLYAAIKYDKYRKVYYRFLRRAIPNATIKTQIKEKPITVIILDSNFAYLGETTIGTSEDWHWQNSFVTQEGLNIEFIDKKDVNEASLNFKIFVPKKIK